MCPWSTDAVISSTAIFVAITNNTLYGSKLYIFILWQKSLDIKIMLHEDIPTVNISKRNYWLLICIAKNFIWTTLKIILSIFRFFCILRFQIYKYCPNHTSMEILFILQIINIPKNDPYDWFCAPGSHILICCPRNMSDYYKYCIFFAETRDTFAN